jgi:hypothetical protein
MDKSRETDKSIPAIVRGGPQSETSKLPYFLDSWPTDDEAVSLTCRPTFTLRKIAGTHFF